jgi:hypothetical protein
MSLYSEKEYDQPAIKRAIVRYMFMAEKEEAIFPEDQHPEHVTKATKYLKQLRELDPKIVEAATRFSFD